ncbi:MAG: radical SAM family heme chaperone HemW, partial [Chloroflexota bacterium]
SYVNNRRFDNLRGLGPYLARLANHQLPTAHEEPVDATRARADAAMLGLRLVDGIDLAAFNQRFGGNLVNDHAEAIERFVTLGLLEIVAGRLRITPRGFLLANQIWQEFI